jgi:iron complex outermembrane receptor protein
MSRTLAANAFIRGTAFKLPSGDIQIVVGAEYTNDKLNFDEISSPLFPPNSLTSFGRHSYAGFVEARVPLWAHRADTRAGDVLAATVAARYDNYSDVGSNTTPQFGAEWRPIDGLLVRGSFSRAFKAPSLADLNNAQQSFIDTVIDPSSGQPAVPNITSGGNPHLRPETGESKTFGIFYSGDLVPDLRLSVTHWQVKENNSIQELSAQTIVDNADLFPGAVVRAPGQGGQPGAIISVNDTPVNFGDINVAGLDYQINYKYSSSVGTWSPSLAVTQTYKYTAALIPGAPASNRAGIANDDGNFAPRWKGNVSLGWNLARVSASVAARYLGRYQDYDSTQTIGNLWYVDTNIRYAMKIGSAGERARPSETFVSVGAVNLFNRLPQYSNFGFGGVGYDPAEADIRGRFLYASFGVHW